MSLRARLFPPARQSLGWQRPCLKRLAARAWIVANVLISAAPELCTSILLPFFVALMAERDHVAGVARANLERGVGIGHLARLVALGVAGKQLAVTTSAVLVITSGIRDCAG